MLVLFVATVNRVKEKVFIMTKSSCASKKKLSVRDESVGLISKLERITWVLVPVECESRYCS